MGAKIFICVVHVIMLPFFVLFFVVASLVSLPSRHSRNAGSGLFLRGPSQNDGCFAAEEPQIQRSEVARADLPPKKALKRNPIVHLGIRPLEKHEVISSDRLPSKPAGENYCIFPSN